MKVLDDFDFAPRRVEQNEELETVAWAESNGWQCRKLQYQGRVGAPDRMFFGHGALVLMEMKNAKKRNHKNGGLSDGQVKEHTRFREAGVTVHVCYTKDEAVAILRSYM